MFSLIVGLFYSYGESICIYTWTVLQRKCIVSLGSNQHILLNFKQNGSLGKKTVIPTMSGKWDVTGNYTSEIWNKRCKFLILRSKVTYNLMLYTQRLLNYRYQYFEIMFLSCLLIHVSNLSLNYFMLTL